MCVCVCDRCRLVTMWLDHQWGLLVLRVDLRMKNHLE